MMSGRKRVGFANVLEIGQPPVAKDHDSSGQARHNIGISSPFIFPLSLFPCPPRQLGLGSRHEIDHKTGQNKANAIGGELGRDKQRSTLQPVIGLTSTFRPAPFIDWGLLGLGAYCIASC